MLIKNAFFIALCFCVACRSATQTAMISRAQIFPDCEFWVEGDLDKTFIRTGISGACNVISLNDYAKALDSVFSSEGINKTKYPDLDFLYLNIYEGNDSLVQDLINKVNASTAWEQNSNVGLDEAFRLFNAESNYLSEIEKVVRGHFGEKYSLSFQGMQCTPKAELKSKQVGRGLNLKKTCYPLTFGLAVFTKER